MANTPLSLSELLRRLDSKFKVNTEQLHMLSLAAAYWKTNTPLKVTDVLMMFTRTSRATTHRAIKSLVHNKLLQEQASKEDKRIKYLVPGAKFDKYAEEIRRG